MEQPEKARVSDETFNDFLASENLLAVCAEDAVKEIDVDRRMNGEWFKLSKADILAFKKRKFQ